MYRQEFVEWMNDAGHSKLQLLRIGKDLSQLRWGDTFQAHLFCKFLQEPLCPYDTPCPGSLLLAPGSLNPECLHLLFRADSRTSSPLSGALGAAHLPLHLNLCSLGTIHKKQPSVYHGPGLFQLNPEAQAETHGVCGYFLCDIINHAC